jgi:hypothetical protein
MTPLFAALLLTSTLHPEPQPSAPFAAVIAAEKVRPKDAIEGGLAWLARHQREDGSWGPLNLLKTCEPAGKCLEPHVEQVPHYDPGLTALAVLAFLRAGCKPQEKRELGSQATGRFDASSVIRGGLQWLQKRHGKEGFSSHYFLYNEAIGTIAFAEATRADPDGPWRVTLEKAVDQLLAAQRKNPSGTGAWGWRYESCAELESDLAAQPAGAPAEQREKLAAKLHESDTSVTGWAIAALRGAQEAGVSVPQSSIEGALDFLRHVSLANGQVAYLEPKQAGMAVGGTRDEFRYHPATMSALGMIILSSGQPGKKHPFFEAAAQTIVADLPRTGSDRLEHDYYYWYQASVALNCFEKPSRGKRKFAGPWNKALIDASIALQDRTKGACTNGGWIGGDRWSHAGGAVYNTAFNVLALEACTATD